MSHAHRPGLLGVASPVSYRRKEWALPLVTSITDRRRKLPQPPSIGHLWGTVESLSFGALIGRDMGHLY